METPDTIELGWCLLLANVLPDDLADLCARLLFSKTLTDALLDAAKLVQNEFSEQAPPSHIVNRLEGISNLVLYAAWIIHESSSLRQQFQQYAHVWRSVRPKTDGHALQARGLKPGPC